SIDQFADFAQPVAKQRLRWCSDFGQPREAYGVMTLLRTTKVARGGEIMTKTLETNISVTRATQEVLRKKSWRFATALWVSLAAVTAGLLILPSAVQAADRLTDEEVQDLLASVESS